MHYLVPTLDLGWGIFTLLQYRATSYGEIMAYRFMVSLFEVRMHRTWNPLNQALIFKTNAPRRLTSQEYTLFWVRGIGATRLDAAGAPFT